MLKITIITTIKLVIISKVIQGMTIFKLMTVVICRSGRVGWWRCRMTKWKEMPASVTATMRGIREALETSRLASTPADGNENIISLGLKEENEFELQIL